MCIMCTISYADNFRTKQVLNGNAILHKGINSVRGFYFNIKWSPSKTYVKIMIVYSNSYLCMLGNILVLDKMKYRLKTM